MTMQCIIKVFKKVTNVRVNSRPGENYPYMSQSNVLILRKTTYLGVRYMPCPRHLCQALGLFHRSPTGACRSILGNCILLAVTDSNSM